MGLEATIKKLRGTRESAADWTDPAKWIPDRLEGSDLELAMDIWERTRGSVNPRHVYGHWLLAQRYDLLTDGKDKLLEITATGRNFLDTLGGAVEIQIDNFEGVIKLLSIVADCGPCRLRGLVEEWKVYLKRHSKIDSESMTKDALRRRLNNLIDRQFVERKSRLYSVTAKGLDYLKETSGQDSASDEDHNQLWALLQRNVNTVRTSLRELLHQMDPFAFEHLIRRLLEEMDYQNVEVTSRSGDGGVDVVAEIELGITSVREVVQAKRHRQAIQRKDLDALRGSLWRFNAVRGTIVTTSQFARGTLDAAFADAVAPITLVDGDKLIELLIEYGICIRKRKIEVLEIDTDAINAIEEDYGSQS